MRLLPSALLIALLAACNGTAPDANSPTPAAPSNPASNAGALNVDEDDWHAVDSMVAVLGGVQGKVVADLSAGDGHYVWQLLKAGAKVIAIDENANNIAALEARKKELGLGDDRLQIRMASPGSINLQPEEVDIALITRPYSGLPEHSSYFSQIRTATRAPHTTVVVDFLQQQTPVGPPMEERTNPEQIMDELGVLGYQDVVSLTKKMPYRFLLIAQDLPPGAM